MGRGWGGGGGGKGFVRALVAYILRVFFFMVNFFLRLELVR